MFKFNLLGLIFVLTYLFNSVSSQSPFIYLNCQFNGSPPYCNWETSTNSWTFRSGGSSSMNIQFSGPPKPPAQITSFIQIYSPQNRNLSSADLTSLSLPAKSTTNCFKFYYYIHGEGARSIQLVIIKSTGTHILWQRKGSAGDMWHTYSININPQQTNYQLKFIVDSGNGAIGLAAFTTSEGMCSPTSSICDFESGNCNWTSTATNPNYIFKLTSIKDSPNNIYDHSINTDLGHFMEATGGNTGDSTNLTSPMLQDYLVPFCLQFWYWRNLSEQIKIDVITKSYDYGPRIVWTSENQNFPNKVWHRARVDFLMDYWEYLTIRATRLGAKSTTKSSIDIDDIRMMKEKCPVPIDCNFNDDMCGWTRDYYQNRTWQHGIGRLENIKVLPTYITIRPTDRTAPNDGMFIYTDFTHLQSGEEANMVMSSEYVPATSGSCLSLFYLPLQFTAPFTQFKIITADLNGNKTNIKTIASMPFSKTWTQMQISINSSQLFRIILEVTTTSPSTYLAIDDITYKAGSCNGTVVTTPRPIVTNV